MKLRALGVLFAVGGLCAAAQASVFFTFEDPATGPEITYTDPDDNQTNSGVLSYTGALVNLVVDGTQESLPLQSFTAVLQLQFSIGAVDDPLANILTAPILGGSFQFLDVGGNAESGSNVILSGDVTGGGLITLGTVGSLLSTSTTDGLTMAAGPALAGFLGGQALAPTFDISFTLTNISPAVTTTQGNFITSFTANSAFTGNAELVPSPGSIALIGLSAAAMLLVRRKRS